ncbi:SulP family inorganic anion transporter [Nocardioides lianchengensis]|uniref:Sulfate permease, SulP family n=1 Tax=Nocardioides lianchengensis TaxID=1045774 RepID=A0A1G6W4B0_9ACTN|nr:SulP family inorganic anion transporter [Nocardioides lianchengensis]NYG09469.1 SulP family sulfate permease [Nocardioides lianchengensis]SDD59865.1 sulfate permease, SulP family [Nocardioides lianchengensis]
MSGDEPESRAWIQAWLGDLRPRRRHFRSDLVAGLPGAISSVPDGMAASVLAGVNPAHGLYASFAGPVAGGVSSSTRLMVVTTTSAAALAAGSAVESFGPDQRSDALLWLTLMGGTAMVAAALLNLSRFARFVSRSVLVGFLAGVSVNMVLGQLPDLLGIAADGDLAITRAADVVRRLPDVDGPSAAAGLVALLVLVVLGRTPVAVLGSLLALAVPTVAVLLVGAGSVALVEDTGRIPHGLPPPQLPDPAAFDLSLVGGALAVAALVLVQGVGVAEAVPNPDGSPTSTRRDFTSQGLANAASGLFGGMPVGGSVGQTALNVSAGARSRWASIWSGLWMAVILLAFSGVVGEVAMPTLAAVLVYAGWGSVHPRELLAVARAGRIPAVAMLGTLGAVLVLPVAEAVAVGVVASLLLQLNQDSLDLRVVRLVRTPDGAVREEPLPTEVGPGDVVVVNVYGSLFYAGARTLQRRLPVPRPGGPVVVLRLRGRTTLGATFLKVVGDYAQQLAAADGELYLTGVDPDVAASWRDGPLAGAAGHLHVVPATEVLGASTWAAVAAATGEPPGPVHAVRPS